MSTQTPAKSKGQIAAEKLWTVAPAYWPEKDWPRTVTFGILAETVAEAVKVSPTAEALVSPHNATLRRSQPVFSLEQIAREAAEKWNNIVWKDEVALEGLVKIILRACQAAASQAAIK